MNIFRWLFIFVAFFFINRIGPLTNKFSPLSIYVSTRLTHLLIHPPFFSFTMLHLMVFTTICLNRADNTLLPETLLFRHQPEQDTRVIMEEGFFYIVVFVISFKKTKRGNFSPYPTPLSFNYPIFIK